MAEATKSPKGGDARHRGDPAMEERLARIVADIRSGERARREKDADRAQREQQEAGAGVGAKILGGVARVFKWLFAIPKALFSLAGAIGAGVVRRTVDKLTGSQWENDAKQAKLEMMGLQEMGRENVEKFRQEIKTNQQKMSRLHHEQGHIEEDMRTRTMSSLAGKTSGPAGEVDPRNTPTDGSLSQGTGLPSPEGDARHNKRSRVAVNGYEMKLLSEVSQHYHALEDGRFAAVDEALQSESLEALKSNDSHMVLRAIQKIVCAQDPKLGGRPNTKKELEGPNAVLRIAANQVVAQEVTELLLEDIAQSENPEKFVQSMIESIEHGSTDNTFYHFVRATSEHLADNRDAIYKAVRDPLNTGRHADWAWLKAAYEEYQGRISAIEPKGNRDAQQAQAESVDSEMLNEQVVSMREAPENGVANVRPQSVGKTDRAIQAPCSDCNAEPPSGFSALPPSAPSPLK